MVSRTDAMKKKPHRYVFYSLSRMHLSRSLTGKTTPKHSINLDDKIHRTLSSSFILVRSPSISGVRKPYLL